MTGSDKLRLVITENGPVLTDGTLQMTGDLSHLSSRIRPGNLQRELLVKAARIKGKSHKTADRVPLAVDATAGLGEDSLLLAAAGFSVIMYEYNPLVAALLRDALKKAKEDARLSDIASRMSLLEEDSIKALPQIKEHPDVILLDPMFPKRSKSGLIKKKFQLIQQIEMSCDNEKELLEAAISANPCKIIIKRPVKGKYLADVRPDYSLEGSVIRYDVIVTK